MQAFDPYLIFLIIALGLICGMIIVGVLIAEMVYRFIRWMRQ